MVHQKEFNTFNEETTRVTRKKGLFGTAKS